MFNDNASDLDRQKKLQELIRGNDEEVDPIETAADKAKGGITTY